MDILTGPDYPTLANRKRSVAGKWLALWAIVVLVIIAIAVYFLA